MQNGGDDRVKKRAYELWETEGRPEGKDKEHWTRAESESSSEETSRTIGPDGSKITKVTKRKKSVGVASSDDAPQPARGDNG